MIHRWRLNLYAFSSTGTGFVFDLLLLSAVYLGVDINGGGICIAR